MLTFYYNPLSPIARRVWLALLEKGLSFNPRLVNLTGEQFQPDFLALNPFHHVPVLTDGDLRLIESLAILDYLEAQYPTPSLQPESAIALAQMRMVQFVVANELMPKIPTLINQSDRPEAPASTIQTIDRVLIFLTRLLGEAPYFGGATLSLADITAGAALPLLPRLGVDLVSYPAIAAWLSRVSSRPAWQQTEPDDAAFALWKRWLSLQIKRRQRQLSRT